MATADILLIEFAPEGVDTPAPVPGPIDIKQTKMSIKDLPNRVLESSLAGWEDGGK